MTYNADSPNKAWSEAVCNSIKNTLGIECTAVPTVDFATYNKKLDADEMKGIFRAGMAGGLSLDRELPDAALLQGCLPPEVPTRSMYNNPEFEKLLAQAAEAPSLGRGQQPVSAGRGIARH